MIDNYCALAHQFGLIPANGCNKGTRGFIHPRAPYGCYKFVSTETFCAILRLARKCFYNGKESSNYDRARSLQVYFGASGELFVKQTPYGSLKLNMWVSKHGTDIIINKIINTDFRWIQRTKRGPKWITK